MWRKKAGNLTADEWKSLLDKAIMDISLLLSRLIGDEIAHSLKRANIADKIAMKLAPNVVEKKIAPYISAVILLAFVGKQATEEGVSSLLTLINIMPEKRFLSFASSLDFSYKIPYAPSLYFLFVMGRDATPENLAKTVESMGNKADIATAAEVISANDIIMAEANSATAKLGATNMQTKLDEGIHKTASLIGKLMESELDRVMQYDEVASNLDAVLPYVSTVGVLGFTGRDIKIEGVESFKKSMMELMASAGVVPDEKIADYVETKIGFGNFPFAYIPSLYFAVSNGLKPEIGNLIKVLDALKIPADNATAGFICSFYEDNKDYSD